VNATLVHEIYQNNIKCIEVNYEKVIFIINDNGYINGAF
jgi:hypothetical protein